MFGRRKDDEDPFAALKDGGTYQSKPTTIPDIGISGVAEPSATPTAVGPSPGPAAPPVLAPPRMTPPGSLPPLGPPGSLPPLGPPRQSRRYSGAGISSAIVLRLAIAAVVIAAIAVPVLSFSHSVQTTLSVPSFSTPSFSTPATPTPPPAPTISYLTPRGARAGLAHIARLEPGARLTLLRLDARSLSTGAVLRGGAIKQIYIGPTGTVITAGASSGEQPIAISAIHASVVGRLVSEMSARFHVSRNRIDYMVLSSPSGLGAHWIIFSKDAAHHGYSATLSGAGLAPLPG